MGAPPKPKVKMEKDGAERYLITYADLMNLLLIFFIVLYAMSKVDTAKFNQLAASLNAALGSSTGKIVGDAAGGVLPFFPSAPKQEGEGQNAGNGPGKLEEMQFEGIKDQIDKMVQSGALNGQVTATVEERGVVISINAQALFKSGSSAVESGSRGTLVDIGKMLMSIPDNQIRVEGHTDTDPISTREFPTNWELSSVRATNVLRLLVDSARIDPRQISAVGYGEFRPMVPNTSEANKQKNRRVDIVVIRSALTKSEASDHTSATPTPSPSGTSGHSATASPSTSPAADEGFSTDTKNKLLKDEETASDANTKRPTIGNFK